MRKSNEEDQEHLVRMRKSVMAFVKNRESRGFQVNGILKRYVENLEKNPQTLYYSNKEDTLDVL